MWYVSYDDDDEKEIRTDKKKIQLQNELYVLNVIIIRTPME